LNTIVNSLELIYNNPFKKSLLLFLEKPRNFMDTIKSPLSREARKILYVEQLFKHQEEREKKKRGRRSGKNDENPEPDDSSGKNNV